MKKNCSCLCQGFILNRSSSFAPGTFCGAEQTALQGHNIGIRDPAINGKYPFNVKDESPRLSAMLSGLCTQGHIAL